MFIMACIVGMPIFVAIEGQVGGKKADTTEKQTLLKRQWEHSGLRKFSHSFWQVNGSGKITRHRIESRETIFSFIYEPGGKTNFECDSKFKIQSQNKVEK